MLLKPHGLILVAAPPRSGRTTALYAGLTMRASEDRNVVALENPVTYDLMHVYQVPVNPDSGLNYGQGLRSALLQDADLVMIDEVPDTAVARSLVQASMTGHLILAGITAQDGSDALYRLGELGVDFRLLASCLVGTVTPRVVRRMCSECRKDIPARELPGHWVGTRPDRLFEASGCPACNQTGYAGRTGLYEVRTMDENLRGTLVDGSFASAPNRSLNRTSPGLVSEGLEKIREGITTVEEILRVTERTA